jgi:hypothetical protein
MKTYISPTVSPYEEQPLFETSVREIYAPAKEYIGPIQIGPLRLRAKRRKGYSPVKGSSREVYVRVKYTVHDAEISGRVNTAEIKVSQFKLPI